ncbi:MAG: hypothetical protein MZU97_03335 [Bacillus subtilis]|nr:hypothetical protein [Bacillus subtilis]
MPMAIRRLDSVLGESPSLTSKRSFTIEISPSGSMMAIAVPVFLKIVRYFSSDFARFPVGLLDPGKSRGKNRHGKQKDSDADIEQETSGFRGKIGKCPAPMDKLGLLG